MGRRVQRSDITSALKNKAGDVSGMLLQGGFYVMIDKNN